VELGYRERASSPSLIPVFAARDGVIEYAGTINGKSTICIDHAGGWSTHYSELAHVLTRPTDRFLRRRKQRVSAGDVIGHAPRATLHIRLRMLRMTDGRSIAVDPGAWLPTWTFLPWFAEPAQPSATRAAV